jgi:hypothetical protein
MSHSTYNPLRPTPVKLKYAERLEVYKNTDVVLLLQLGKFLYHGYDPTLAPGVTAWTTAFPEKHLPNYTKAQEIKGKRVKVLNAVGGTEFHEYNVGTARM